jgi:hypothetical protein
VTPRPRVERLTLFKHGVAYVERRGPAEGSFELYFRRDEMNDILKSLTVAVASGEATVTSIAFDPPGPTEMAPGERPPGLAEGAALTGLLRALTGRIVAIDDGESRQQGQIVGIEETPGGYAPTRRALVIRRVDPPHDMRSHLSVVDLATTRSVRLVEEPARESVDFLVDRIRAATADDSRSVRVAIDGRASEVRVAYVVPSAPWRIAYRIVGEGGETRLLAMGVVHNPVDEDVDGIELTVSTNQPASFDLDLYRAPLRAPAAASAAASTSAPAAAPTPAPPAAAGATSDTVHPEDDHEAFEHTLDARVSLKRGGSAMVPLVSARLAAQKQRVWRDGAGSAPDVVLAFKNDTGLTLEEGPAVFYDEGGYGGEALLPYTPRGGSVRLALAKDLAVRCRRSTTEHTAVLRVSFTSAAVVEELRCEAHHTLGAESDHGLSVEVILELPRRAGRTLRSEALCAVPFEETASHFRYRAKVDPSGKAALFVREAWLETRALSYDAVTAAQVEGWGAAQKIDAAAGTLLGGVIKTLDEVKELDTRRARLDARDPEAAKLRDQAEEGRRTVATRLRRLTG